MIKMTSIVLPPMLEKDKYLSLSASEKGEYAHNLLKEILKLNPEGLTVPQIDAAIYLEHTSIWHHLEILASRADCLKIKRGNVEVYFPNKVIGSLKEFDMEGEYYHYSFELVENIYGKFVRLQTREKCESSSAVDSGVIMRSDIIGDIIKSLTKIKKQYLKK